MFKQILAYLRQLGNKSLGECRLNFFSCSSSINGCLMDIQSIDKFTKGLSCENCVICVGSEATLEE